MITAVLQNTNELLIDFGAVVTNFGISPGQFTLNGTQAATSITFSNDQFATAVFTLPLPQGELWLSYDAPSAGAQIISTGASAVAIRSFEVLVLETAGTSPAQMFNISNTAVGPTLGDFIQAYGLKEAIEISNPGSSSATQPNELKFLRAFEDAEALWTSEVLNASASSLLVLNPGKRRTILTIARYFLDSACPRDFVVSAYEEVIRNLRATISGVSNPDTVFTGGDDFFWYEGSGCSSGCGGCGSGNPSPEFYQDPWRF